MKFEKELTKLLKKSISNQFTGNSREWPDFIYDENLESPKSLKIRHKIKSFFQADNKAIINDCLQRFDIKGLGETYDLLGDTYSKNLLVRIIAFRMLGPGKIKMPMTERKSWDQYFKIKKMKQKEKVSSKDYEFNLFDLNELGYNIKLFYDDPSIFINLGLKQYEYSRSGFSCKASLGDFVIDGGACFGDTALYFANEVGPRGKVFSFEFIPDNLKILQTNLSLNPDLKKIVTVVKNPLWRTAKKDLFVIESGPGSKVSQQKPDIYDFKVATESIDNFIETRGIKKVDFIKLDIEGAELDCLKGAKKSLLQYRPKLAICIYHDIEHFVSIPKYIHELLPDYDWFIDHYTIHLWETVLYGIPRNA